MSDTSRPPRTLSATPEVTGPEGSFELGDDGCVCTNLIDGFRAPDCPVHPGRAGMLTCAGCGEVFDAPPPSDPPSQYDTALLQAMTAGTAVLDPACFAEALRSRICGAEKMGYVCRRTPGHDDPGPDYDELHADWCGTESVMIAYWSTSPDAGPGVRVRSIDHSTHALLAEIAREAQAG